MAGMKRDPNTLSNYDKWLCRHIGVNLDLDFRKNRLVGYVELQLESIQPAGEVILDTSYLDIRAVKIAGLSTKWELLPRKEPYGSPLKIDISQHEDLGHSINIIVEYSTTERCTALQWLTPAQTSNKKHPYVFAQCQPIHGRSCLPCQDTPDVKTTFSYNVRSPLPVITSGLPTGSQDWQPGVDGQPGTLLYTSKQAIPIPSYLFSIVSGDLATATIGPRSVVVSGPEELNDSKWEFEKDMEPFIGAAERILNPVPYVWTAYNVLVLPASFPFGGMETPVFTLATPTLISGDRENVSVIAHELAHSWSGNLVSNASWEHFWLNEGWTTYLERRIVAEIYGEPHRGFQGLIGWDDLSNAIRLFGEEHEYTKLVVQLKDKDPDDAFSAVPYEKGFVFLYHLETLLGKDKFDKFIPYYFATWAKKSLVSDDFKTSIIEFFNDDVTASKQLLELDWDKWYYSSGFPPKPDFDTSLADACYSLADKWNGRRSGDFPFEPSANDIHGWSSNQLVVFLERISGFKTSITTEDSVLMGSTYSLSASKNVEVSSRYLGVALRAGNRSAAQPTAELLGQVGRMKFVRPLFRALEKFDRQLAVETYEKNKNFYHPICRERVRLDLFGKKSEKIIT